MPVNILKNKININQNGQYGSIDAVTDQSTASRIADINAVADEKVQDIEDKGEEVLNSIPTDYTEMSTDVNVLKANFNSLGFSVVDGMLNVTYTEGE